MKVAIWFGLAAIVITAVALIFRFTDRILSRLKLLIQNTRRIGKFTQTLTPVPGNDEIAYLNSVLIEADEELRRAEDHRKWVIGMVAHDMRSPLMAAQIALDIVDEAGGESLLPQVSASIDRAGHNLSRASRFVEDLLEIERLEAGQMELKFETLSAREIAEACIASINEAARARGIKLISVCHDTTFEGDRLRLEQVIKTTVQRHCLRRIRLEVVISDESINGNVAISVKDLGAGIDRDTSARIFDRYFQTEAGRQVNGYGLGLSICRLLAAAHKGAVGVESTPAKGSVFWIMVPVKQSKKPPSLTLVAKQ